MADTSAGTDPASAPGADFEHTDRNSYGYHTKQVDQFFHRARQAYAESESPASMTSRDVREMTFDTVRGGYAPGSVDAALDRVEDLFAQRERDQLIAGQGEEAWLAQIGSLSTVLRGRLHRQAGERFRRPRRHRARSYNIADVDALCEQILGYFEHDKPMSVDTVRRAIFDPAKGRDGYEEHQVDGFLDRVIELMAAID